MTQAEKRGLYAALQEELNNCQDFASVRKFWIDNKPRVVREITAEHWRQLFIITYLELAMMKARQVEEINDLLKTSKTEINFVTKDQYESLAILAKQRRGELSLAPPPEAEPEPEITQGCYKELSWKGKFYQKDGVLVPADDEAKKIMDTFPKSKTLVYWDDHSIKHRGLYFGAIKAAYDNWPETHRFKPGSQEGLRWWLECEAGYEAYKRHEIPDPKNMKMIVTFGTWIGGLKKMVNLDVEGTEAVARVAKSISYGTMAEEKFKDISGNVDNILIAETNCSLNDFKNGIRYAA